MKFYTMLLPKVPCCFMWKWSFLIRTTLMMTVCSLTSNIQYCNQQLRKRGTNTCHWQKQGFAVFGLHKHRWHYIKPVNGKLMTLKKKIYYIFWLVVCSFLQYVTIHHVMTWWIENTWDHSPLRRRVLYRIRAAVLLIRKSHWGDYIILAPSQPSVVSLTSC